jgi:hypothetical protein
MTDVEATTYLIERGDRYGLSLQEVREMIPLSIRDDVVKCAEFAELRDLSHDLPQSTHPELANDPSNIMFEDPSANRSRGAVEMTNLEELVATIDNEVLAAQIDLSPKADFIPDFIPVLGLI